MGVTQAVNLIPGAWILRKFQERYPRFFAYILPLFSSLLLTSCFDFFDRRPSSSGSIYPYESNRLYNTYEFCSTTATFSVDKTFWGAFRWIVAPEFSQNVIRTYDYPNGTSKRTQDYQADLINGYHDISTKGYKFSYGAGLRIIWNQATVILIDYAKSREDSQLFIDIGQIF